jgi:type IV secretory pathway VirB10-like protein
MRPRFIPALIAVLAACLCGHGSSFASKPDQVKSAAGEEHGVLVVELTRPLNSQNLKPGGTVEATVRVGQNGMSIPRGSKIVGHVTEVKSRSKGDTKSALGIVFDTIIPPAGASPTSIQGRD